MNKIFKVVWSRVKHCYVVTSEIAKSTGRSKSSVGTATVAAMACAVALTMVGGEAQAWTLKGPGMPSSGRVISDGNILDVQNGIGTTAVLSAGNTSTMRYNVNREVVTVNDATGGVTSPTDSNNIAFSTASEVSKAIATSGFTLDVNLIDPDRDNVERSGNTVINPGEKITITAAGLSNVEYVEAENGAGIRINTNATPITVGSNGKVTYADNDTDPDTAGNQAVTAGDVINAINNSGWYTNAVGSNITGSATKTLIKSGGTVNFEAGDGLKIQQNVNPSTNTVTYRFDATNTGTAAAGENTYFHVNTKDIWPGSGSTKGSAVGNDGTGNATTNLGASSTASGATGAKSIAAGENAQAAGAWSIAMGTNATVKGESHQTDGIAIGADSYVMADKAANYRSSIAIGSKASVRGGTVTVTDPASGKSREASFGRGSVAIGTNALANRIVTNGAISDSDALYNTNSGALTGTSSNKNASIMWLAGMENDQLDNNEATAIGFDARAVGDQSIAIGAQVVAGHASVAIGGNDMESVVDPRANAPEGKAKENAATYERIVGEAIADNRILVNGKDFWPTTSAKEGSVAIGQKTFSRTLMGTAIGTSAAVNEGGTLGTAIGAGARVGASDGSVLTEGGVAIAAGAVAEKNHTTAIGTGTQVLATDATAIGYQNKVTGERSVALGNELNVITADSVVLGSGSKGDDTASTVTSGTIRGTDYDTDSTDTFTYSGFAGKIGSTGHYVSVGAPNGERQIKNVAPGEISSTSTDAINGSQLYVVTNVLHNRGLNFTADNTTASDSNTTVHRDLGETLKIEGDNNIKTTADHNNGKVSIGLNKDVTLGKATDPANPTTPGEDGSLTVTGQAGNTVAINGGDGSINMAGPNNSNAISIKPSEGPATLEGTPDANGNTPNISRITYDRTEPVLDADGNPVLDADGNPQTRTVTETVATMNDGLRFTGNNTDTVNKHKLNTLVTIKGEGVDKDASANFQSAAGNINVKANGTDTLEVQLNKDLQHINTISNGNSKLTLNANPSNGGKDADGNDIPVTPAVQINGGNLDMGDNKITNLAPGTAPTDAATVGQLTTVTSPNKTISVVDTNLNEDGTVKDSSKGHTYEIEVNSQSVVNNAQTPVVYTDAAGNKVYKQADGTFNTAIDGTGTVVQPDNVIASMNDGGNSTHNPMILNNVGSAIQNKDGDTFLEQLDNAAKPVADGGTPNAAVNVSDLKNTADGLIEKGLNFTADNTTASDRNTTVHRNLSETLKIEGDNNIKTTADHQNAKISVGLNKDVTLGKATDPANPTTLGEDGSLTVTGKAGNTVAINGGDGSINMAGPNNSNAISIKPSEGPATLEGTPDANGNTPNISRITYDRTEPVLDADGNPVLDADGNPQTRTVTETVATMNDGLRFTGNNTDTVNKHKLNTLVTIKGEGVDKDASANFQSAAGNINVKANGTDTLEVQLNKDLQGINTITNGRSSITLNENPANNGGNAVTINGGNLNMNKGKITNVGRGEAPTDAATVGQLPQVTSSNDSVRISESVDDNGAKVYDLAVDTVSPAVVNELADEIGRVGAQGAALAALKPIQYDPLEPTQIMAGYGNYRGNSALALGVAHYKNESTMIHGGVSWATGDGRHMMANAGITWKVGSRDSEAAIADRYRKGPISSAYALQNEVAAMKAENTGLKGEVADLKAENAEMKAENQEMKAQIAMLMQRLGL